MFRLADGYPDHFLQCIRKAAYVEMARGGEGLLGTFPFIRSLHHRSGRGSHFEVNRAVCSMYAVVSDPFEWFQSENKHACGNELNVQYDIVSRGGGFHDENSYRHCSFD
jgi:hypothetical protein